MFKKHCSTVVSDFVALAGFTFLCLPAVAQVQAVQIPFTAVGAGIAPTTFNGTAPATAAGCGAGVAYDTFGDGCLPTQAVLENNTGLTIDSLNNMYIAEDENGAAKGPTLRVVYRGGSALAAALINANNGVSGFPSSLTPGNIYGISARSSTLTSTFCNGVSGATRLDIEGDGCLANQAYWEASQVQVDAGGNIFLINDIGSFSGYNSIKVIYVGGGTSAQNAAVINLIRSYTPLNASVTTPCSGCIYELSNSTSLTQSDFVAGADIAIDANENLYVADAGANATVTGELASNSGNQIKKYVSSPTAGWVTYIPSGAASIATADGDGSLPASASVNSPLQVQVDANGNLYISDLGNQRIRVVYNSAGLGTLPPVYIENGTTPTAVPSPTAGYIYTVAGGQPSTTSPATSRSSGISASKLYTGNSGPYFGLDQAGNLYVYNRAYDATFAINRVTGIAQLIAGTGGSTATGALGTPAPGAFCNGGTSGPTMTDGYGSGCPAIQVNGTTVYGHLSFDSSGSLYMDEKHTANDLVGLIRKYSFTNQFGTVPDGSSSTQVIAFSPLGSGAVYSITPTLSLVNSAGTASAEFTDAGSDTCTVTNTTAQTCLYNVKFTPAAVGPRLGALTLTSGGSAVATSNVGGTGDGAQISLDPATQTTIGTGLAPVGVAIDQSGNLYIADSISNTVFKSTAGGAPVSFATGFNKPTQLAVSAGSTVYVADSGNNRIAVVTQAGVVSTLSQANNEIAYTFSNPSGVAVDSAGNIFISDTSNNRVLKVAGSVISSGNVTVLGFSGLSSPLGLAVDAAGDVFVADSGNARIVKLSAAGVQSVVTVTPSLSNPVGVSVDPAGNLYIADSGNQNVVLVPYGSTVATALQNLTTDLAGIAVDNSGNIALAASQTGGVLAFNRTQITYAYPVTNVGATSGPVLLTLTNVGNNTLTTGSSLDGGTDVTNFSITPATTNGCTTGESILTGGQCILAATFQPKSAATFTDTVTFPASNAVNGAKATLIGAGGGNEIATSTVLLAQTPGGPQAVAGQAFNIVATITPVTNSSNVSGTVTFSVNGVLQTPSITVVNGTTTTSTISLTLGVGTYTISATYSGDTMYDGSTATPVSVTVVASQATTTDLQYSLGTAGTVPNTINTTLTATISALNPVASVGGYVTFTIDNIVQNPTVNVTGNAATITVGLTAGSHTVQACYSGTSYYFSSCKTITFPVVSGTSALVLTATPPSGNVTYGQAVVINATTTTGNSPATPGGTITFTINNVVQTPVAFASPLMYPLQYPTNLLPAGTNTILASYSGDSNYAPAKASITVVVARALPMLSLISTPTIGVPSNYFTLTASLTAAPTIPSGSVAFTDGSASLGAPVNVDPLTGKAVETTTTNALSSYSFTATYSGDANFLPAAVTISSTPLFVLTNLTPTITVAQNAVGVGNLSLSSFYGYTGTLRITCTGLPAYTACGGSPTLTTMSADNVQAVQLQIATDVPPIAHANLTLPNRSGRSLGIESAALLACCFLALRKRRQRLGYIAVSILLLINAGCASSTADTNNYVTPIGTYAVTVVASDGTNTSLSNLTLIVTQGTLAARP